MASNLSSQAQRLCEQLGAHAVSVSNQNANHFVGVELGEEFKRVLAPHPDLERILLHEVACFQSKFNFS